MIIYRPHRGGFEESMKLAREFESVEEMKAYIVHEHEDPLIGRAFCSGDIVIEDETINDIRNSWKDTRKVCVNWYFAENFVEEYGSPQCIGHCATEY